MRFLITAPGMPRKTYVPQDVCIYCGQPPVGDEHIVPRGLGGGMVLPKASCRNCERTTSRFEKIGMEGFFRFARHHMGVRGAREPRARRKRLPVWIERNDRSEFGKLEVADHPLLIMLYAFNAPDILLGLPPPTSDRPRDGRWWFYRDQNFAQKLARFGAKSFAVTGKANMGCFMQMIAKIGHSFAVAELGLEKFQPLLPSVILGTPDETMRHLIGGSVDPVPPTSALHEVSLLKKTVVTKTARLDRVEEFWVARIRLFAKLGAPVYFAVVGRPL